MALTENESLPAAYAIFEGGGVKGSALVGALAESVRHVNIVGVGGTSAGAIVAALYAAGHTPQEMQSLMLEMDYRRLAKRLFLPKNFGWHSSRYIYEWLRDRISLKVKQTLGDSIA